MNSDELYFELLELVGRLTNGCGNHGCVIKQPDGVGTNGPCRCTVHTMAKTLIRLGNTLLDTRPSEFKKRSEKDGGRLDKERVELPPMMLWVAGRKTNGCVSGEDGRK